MPVFLPRYFATLFFAQLVTSSLDLLCTHDKENMRSFMRDFLQDADPRDIHEHEVRNGYIWSTVVPFVKLAYFPSSHLCPIHEHFDLSLPFKQRLGELQQLCIEAGVFSLQNILSGEQAQQILVQEGLVDYITCMPWNLPKVLHSRVHRRAKELALMLSQNMRLQPPQLTTIARAKLAAAYFGLEKILRIISPCELLGEPMEVYPPQSYKVSAV